MELISLFISLLSLAGFYLVTNFSSKLIMEESFLEHTLKAMRGRFTGNISGKERDRYANTYLKAFTTLNIRPLTSICSDLCYHNTLNEINLLTRLGIRKEVGLKADNLSGGTEALNTTAGNLLWVSHQIPGTLHLRYVDNTTDYTLEEQWYKNCSLLLSLTKNPLRQKPAVQYCTGCGGEMNASGEIYTCPSCGNTYKSDSYDWVMNQLTYNESLEESGAKIVLYATYVYMLGNVLLGILSLFIKWLFFPAIIFAVLSFAAYTGYMLYMSKYVVPQREVQKTDPFCTPTRLNDRIMFLISMLLNCRSTNRNIAKQFMDTQAFEAWQAADSAPTGRHVISVIPLLYSGYTGYTVDEARQHLGCKFNVAMRIFDERTRRMHTEKRVVNMGLYRNRNTVYQNKLTAESLVCSGCGSSIDLNAEGRCKYCGNEYDIAELDWKIEWVDNSLWV